MREVALRMTEELSHSEVHETMTDMLADLAVFAMNQDLKLFLLGGTLLGKIRDGELIPWDDDIDVGLRREDYEKFKTQYSSKNPNYYLLTEEEAQNDFPYMRLIDKTTHSKSKYYEQKHGIFIDIFPIDDFSKNKIQLDIFFIKHKYLNVMRNIGRSTGKYPKKAKAKKIKEMLRQALPNLSAHKLAVSEDKYVKKFAGNPKKPKQSGVLNGMYGRKEVFPAKMWREVERVDFLGIPVWQVKNYDEYLTQFFGNWHVKEKHEKKHGSFYKGEG